MNKLQQLIEAAKAAQEEITNPQGRLHYHSTEFYNLANPTTILELCALLEKAEGALDYQIGWGRHYGGQEGQAEKAEEALAAIKQWKEQT